MVRLIIPTATIPTIGNFPSGQGEPGSRWYSLSGSLHAAAAEFSRPFAPAGLRIHSPGDLYLLLALHPVQALVAYVLVPQIPGGRTPVYDGGVF
jgi:hypothetical protein